VWVVPRPFHLARLLPNFNALEGSTIAIKEYLSTVVYRLKGWIK